MVVSEESIEYSLRSSPLGRLLVAGTQRGVCFVDFGTSDRELRERLAREFPFADCRAVRGPLVRSWADQIARCVDGRSDRASVPLDVRGSQFQRRVWAALRRIPRGQTRAYSDVARRIGRPTATRAVARACASNPTPVVTPCHRVIEKGGGLGGYARGVRRKRRLLEIEGALQP